MTSLLQASWLLALPAHHYSQIPVQPLNQPQLLAYNSALATQLGWPQQQALSPQQRLLLAGSLQTPPQPCIATVYSGHQFGVWAGQLGDGRALFLGDTQAPDGQRWEIQLKGAGPTPYSRHADGRAVLRSSIREYLASEALHALGIPTTRALALSASNDAVYREQAETAAIVTRVAPSFLRFGHFEHWYHRGQVDDLVAVSKLVLQHCYPTCLQDAQPYLSLFRHISQRSAQLVAAWQSVGFCHGVLNTDNMSLLGLTLDYGPFAFIDGFDPHYVCNHSDRHGRYAYHAQPAIVQWNLSRLAACFLTWLEEAALVEVLNEFVATYQHAYLQNMRAKLGLMRAHRDDQALVDELLQAMAAARVDYSLCFRHLSLIGRDATQPLPEALAALWPMPSNDLQPWLARYRQRLHHEDASDAARAEQMNRVNPKYVLRQHLLQEAITAAEQGDLTAVHTLFNVVARPYDEQPEYAAMAALPPAWAANICVSCSS